MTLVVIVVLALLAAALSRSEAARRILFRLWLIGSGLWGLLWIARMTRDETLSVWTAFFATITPALAVLVLACLLGWAFQRVRPGHSE